MSPLSPTKSSEGGTRNYIGVPLKRGHWYSLPAGTLHASFPAAIKMGRVQSP